jgi:hypothetical protein
MLYMVIKDFNAGAAVDIYHHGEIAQYIEDKL